MAKRVCVLDGRGPKDSENTHNSFSPKRDEDGFWQIGTDRSPAYRATPSDPLDQSHPLDGALRAPGACLSVPLTCDPIIKGFALIFLKTFWMFILLGLKA